MQSIIKNNNTTFVGSVRLTIILIIKPLSRECTSYPTDAHSRESGIPEFPNFRIPLMPVVGVFFTNHRKQAPSMVGEKNTNHTQTIRN